MWIQQTLIFAADVLTVDATAPAAARLYGATRSSSAAGSPSFRRQLDGVRSRLVRIVSEPCLEDLIAVGEDMSIEQAARLAEDALTANGPEGPLSGRIPMGA
jgi:hypothetical protein